MQKQNQLLRNANTSYFTLFLNEKQEVFHKDALVYKLRYIFLNFINVFSVSPTTVVASKVLFSLVSHAEVTWTGMHRVTSAE